MGREASICRFPLALAVTQPGVFGLSLAATDDDHGVLRRPGLRPWLAAD
jgi:hypothetical protein